MSQAKNELTPPLEWAHWGEHDPLFGVLAFPGKGKDSASPWEPGEFFKTGEDDWDRLRPIWQQYGLDHSSCVDLGCGVGRLSRPMSRDFGHVHAMDISPGMLRYAGTWSSPKITFHLTDGTIPLAPASAGAVFSLHTFNVLASQEAQRQCFREIFRVLKPGGSMMVQLPVYQLPSSGQKLLAFGYRTVQWLKGLRHHRQRRLLQAGQNTPCMCYTETSAPELLSFLGTTGFTRVEIRTLPMHGAMTIVLAAKP